LTKTLKGLDKRFHLVAFASTKLPSYIIVGPAGIQVIVTRTHDGAISCRSNTWRRDVGSGFKRLTGMFGGIPFGDPSEDAAKGIAQVRKQLADAGIPASSQPPIDAVIAFTNPAAKLRNDGCTYPVTGLKGLRGTIRGGGGGKGSRDRALDERSAAQVVQALTG
jgi:hypothetical protein